MLYKSDINREVYLKTGYRVEDIKTIIETYLKVLENALINDDGFKYDWLQIKVIEMPEKAFYDCTTKEFTISSKRRRPSLRITQSVKKEILYSNAPCVPRKRAKQPKKHSENVEIVKVKNEKLKSENK